MNEMAMIRYNEAMRMGNRIACMLVWGVCIAQGLMVNGSVAELVCVDEAEGPLAMMSEELMRAWSLVAIIRSASYRDSGIYNRELFYRLLLLYESLCRWAPYVYDKAGAGEVLPLRGMLTGVRALCDVQSPDVVWPFDILMKRFHELFPVWCDT